MHRLILLILVSLSIRTHGQKINELQIFDQRFISNVFKEEGNELHWSNYDFGESCGMVFQDTNHCELRLLKRAPLDTICYIEVIGFKYLDNPDSNHFFKDSLTEQFSYNCFLYLYEFEKKKLIDCFHITSAPCCEEEDGPINSILTANNILVISNTSGITYFHLGQNSKPFSIDKSQFMNYSMSEIVGERKLEIEKFTLEDFARNGSYIPIQWFSEVKNACNSQAEGDSCVSFLVDISKISNESWLQIFQNHLYRDGRLILNSLSAIEYSDSKNLLSWQPIYKVRLSDNKASSTHRFVTFKHDSSSVLIKVMDDDTLIKRYKFD